MKIRFQTKLLAAFVLLIVIIITSVLLFVNSTIDTLSEKKIEESLRTSQGVFENVLNARRQGFSESTDSFLSSQAYLRGALSVSQNKGLFGEEDSVSVAKLRETSELLYSSVESLDFFRKSPVFVFTDSRGKILFNKVDRRNPGVDISSISSVQVALEGTESIAFWGSKDVDLQKFGILPSSENPILYEIFIKPLTFEESNVKGLMIVGLPISIEQVSEIKHHTQSEISFVANGEVYASSLGFELNLTNLVSEQTNDSLLRFKILDENFIGLITWLKNSDGKKTAASIVFRSKTKELAFYKRLKDVINLIGILSAILSAILASGISNAVTSAIRSLIKGVNEVSFGNLDHQVKVNTRDEFSDLAEAFNKMTSGLKEKEAIKRTFKKYVNPRVVNALLENEDKVKLGGSRRELVIFFSDIAGFTTISETLSPEETVEFLNQYLSKMARIIESLEGIVDKYIGDAVMAYWIEPDSLSAKNHVLACEAAIAQQEAVKELKQQWKDNPALSDFEVRIGIHSGEAIIGNVGSEERMDYTIIGDNVNAAARLESCNKVYGTQTVISESVYKSVEDKFLCRELDLITVAGKTKPMRIYEVLGKKSGCELSVYNRAKMYSEALELYRRGQFKEAASAFSDLHARFPEDLPAKMMTDRCENLVQFPRENWNGVFLSKTK